MQKYYLNQADLARALAQRRGISMASTRPQVSRLVASGEIQEITCPVFARLPGGGEAEIGTFTIIKTPARWLGESAGDK